MTTKTAGTETKAEIIHGKDLRIGDVVDVLWANGRDVVTDLRPYEGPLAYLWPEGARIAQFGTGPAMTIEPWSRHTLYGRMDQDEPRPRKITGRSALKVDDVTRPE